MSAPIDISVIIPVFQDAAGMQACLQSLAQQTLPLERFEVIVVDNGSNPPISIPERGPLHASVVRCATPGSYAARNAGVRAARGTQLAFTDADCVPDAQWLESGISELARATRDVILGGEVRYIVPTERNGVSLYQLLTGFPQAENIARKGFAATANVFCSRRVFDRVGPFEEALLSGGDLEWCLRARRMGIEAVLAPTAIVKTRPRITLGDALRQARRVAAGRYYLKRSGLAMNRPDVLQPNRGPLTSVLSIVTARDFGLFDRLRVLGVASLIKAVSILEGIRIRLGGRAERR
jgi:glycosyltransferase involved in cell wall biosynthesis